MDFDFMGAKIDKVEATPKGCVLNVPNRGTFGIKVYLSFKDMEEIAELLKNRTDNKKGQA